MKDNQLTIYYKGKLDPELDAAIEKLLEGWGYKRWASGYNLENGVRDLAFEITKKD